MIKSIWIDNFKSLVDFKLNLTDFTCLVGLNGSGKSTVLQAMDFISQLMTGELDEWLERRQWERVDINSKLTKKSNIEFKIVIEHYGVGEITWAGSINRSTLRCTQENVFGETYSYLKVEDGFCTIGQTEGERGTLDRFKVVFQYQGSILSQLKDEQISILLEDLKDTILKIRSLDLLSPELLRSKTRDAKGHLGLGGQKLSAFIHELGPNGKRELTNKLSKVYEHLVEVDTKALRSGWKQLEITENFEGQIITSTARHMNDGMLRLMAVLTQLESNPAFLLFDEIENGINPELIEYLIDHLVKSPHQVLVTTHSPMILNFLEDNVAKNGIVYLYKTNEGITKAIRLFKIPSMLKKLNFMGPGEVFIDTDQTQLYKEIANI